ncbi:MULTISPECIES: AAA family ATPase [unclassified Clostridioides]|uniref:AAA family ATPase n=1 Tax=unclassified Clostridioides TaxID=2635829 RepID=UPI001D12D425|nr:AAA family ATPase [Clostridioides sp. ES-S-0049-03]MCC0675035.1 AAA family ATPase [Clostridioides sp. ES-W-0018-02]MCC0710154.1 AAA family ATPase [Clostridioides sp. ES-W-0017-02]
MKNIYIIGGTMGVGKTTVCQSLKLILKNSVFLDGDWCWDMHPFQITVETKKMVLSNICSLLNNFIKCSTFENIIFCWVMHEQSIIDTIISCLDISDCRVINISLICDETVLRKRLKTDGEEGLRFTDVIERSVNYLPMYEILATTKINVSNKSVKEIVEEISKL